MQKQKIGGMRVSTIGLGCMRMADLSVDQAAKVLETAYEAGVNFFDLADIYGGGKSEEIFGQALKKAGIPRRNIYIQSKAGIVPGKRYDFSPKYLLDQAHSSLERMGVDYLDSWLLHRPDALMEPTEVGEAFNQLQDQGLVHYFGVSNQNPGQLAFLQSGVRQPLLINQLQFSLMHTQMIDFGFHTNMADDRSVDHEGGALEYARLHHMTIQAWSPYQYGNFAGVFIDNPKFPELNAAMQKLADQYLVTKNAIATAWILRHPAHIQVIVGSMNPERLKTIFAADEVQLTRQEWYDLYLAAGNDLP